MLTTNSMYNVPFSIIVPTVYGQMIINKNDINQTNALLKTGMSPDHGDIILLAKILTLLGPNLNVIDVGANFGAYTLGLRSIIGESGKMYSFEPQRIIFNMLAGSVALNSFTNIYCYNIAVGERTGTIEIPQFDYFKPLNFGSVEFGPKQVEPLSQERNYNPDSREFVSLITIDSFAYDKIDLMKIDAEGMEIQVLDGAADLIKRSRPIMYIEYLKADQVALLQRVINYDYSVYLNNINFLCIPSELNGSMLAKIPEILKNHGDTLFNNGQLVNAECAYREAIALKPESAEVHNNLGCVLHRTKRFDEAERAYSKTIDLLPDSAIAYINLGLAFVASGKFVEAEQVFRRAAVLNPDYTEGYNTHWATLL